MEQVLTSGIIMGLSGAILWHFSNIVRFGTHTIQEPIKIVLYGEIGALVCVFIFGLYLFVKALKQN